MGVFRALGMAARRWYLLVPLILVAIGVSWLAYRQMPATYTATVVHQVTPGASGGSGRSKITGAELAAELAREVAPPLGRGRPPYTVSARPGSSLIQVEARADDPAHALDTVNSVSDRLRAQLNATRGDQGRNGAAALDTTRPASVGPPGRATGLKVFAATLAFGLMLAVVFAAAVERSARRRRALLAGESDDNLDPGLDEGLDDDGLVDGPGEELAYRPAELEQVSPGGARTGGEPMTGVIGSGSSASLRGAVAAGARDDEPTEVVPLSAVEHDRAPMTEADPDAPTEVAALAPVREAPTEVGALAPVRDTPNPPSPAGRDELPPGRLGSPVRQLSSSPRGGGRSVGVGAIGQPRAVPAGGPASRAAEAAASANGVGGPPRTSAGTRAPASSRPMPSPPAALPRGAPTGPAGPVGTPAGPRAPRGVPIGPIGLRGTPGGPAGSRGTPDDRLVGSPGSRSSAGLDGSAGSRNRAESGGAPVSGTSSTVSPPPPVSVTSETFVPDTRPAGPAEPTNSAEEREAATTAVPASLVRAPGRDAVNLGGSAEATTGPSGSTRVATELGYHPPLVNPFGGPDAATFDSSALWAPATPTPEGSGFLPATPLPAGDSRTPGGGSPEMTVAMLGAHRSPGDLAGRPLRNPFGDLAEPRADLAERRADLAARVTGKATGDFVEPRWSEPRSDQDAREPGRPPNSGFGDLDRPEDDRQWDVQPSNAARDDLGQPADHHARGTPPADESRWDGRAADEGRWDGRAADEGRWDGPPVHEYRWGDEPAERSDSRAGSREPDPHAGAPSGRTRSRLTESDDGFGWPEFDDEADDPSAR